MSTDFNCTTDSCHSAEKMSDTDVQEDPEESPPGVEAFGGLTQEDLSEADAMLWLLDDVTLPPPRVDPASARRCDCELLGHLSAWESERSVQSAQLQLNALLLKADDLLVCLRDETRPPQREALAASVTHFLSTCQPYFTHTDSTSRSSLCVHTPLPFDFYSVLQEFSQQLCEKLEQLVLTYASHSLLCLDEREPHSISPFCIGQIQISSLKITLFRYCTPTPYLAHVDTGFYKRIRWNVERLRNPQQRAAEEQGGASEARASDAAGDTEHYFMCSEDVCDVNVPADGDGHGHGVFHYDMLRIWSIGQWVQVYPDRYTEDIEDWVLCEVPQAKFRRLLSMGPQEPSICFATELLLQQLLF